jgi:hypothetical protein
MIERIASDFEVEIIAKHKQNYLLANTKDFFYHFVFYTKTNGYNEIKQFYVHRFEITDWLSNTIDLNKNTKPFPIAEANIFVSLNYDDAKTSLFFHFEEEIYSISLKDSDFGIILINDTKILDKICIEQNNKDFKKKIITAILEEYEETKQYPFSPYSLTIAAFELKIIKTKKRWQRISNYYHLLKLEYQNSKDLDSYMVSSLMDGLRMIVGKSSCDCSNAGCFFDILNEAFTAFYRQEELLTNGILDEEKVTIQFTYIWNALNAKQRAVLNFLDYQFENTPLINLYLLTPNANVQEYIYKMTFPYQPDSEEDAFLRKIISLVGWYLKL